MKQLNTFHVSLPFSYSCKIFSFLTSALGESITVIFKLSKECQLWNNIDIAIVGIGNTNIIDLFERTFGHAREHSSAVGDIATHFFSQDGRMLNLYQNTLCATTENLKNAKNVVAIACGDAKAVAIVGALQTKLIDTFITDEYTAKALLK